MGEGDRAFPRGATVSAGLALGCSSNRCLFVHKELSRRLVRTTERTAVFLDLLPLMPNFRIRSSDKVPRASLRGKVAGCAAPAPRAGGRQTYLRRRQPPG